MSTQPTPEDLEALARKHGATSYRNRADTQHPAYGFTEDGLRNLLADAISRWGTPAPSGDASHVQKPAENEHVAGDVSKKSPKLNTTGVWAAARKEGNKP